LKLEMPDYEMQQCVHRIAPLARVAFYVHCAPCMRCVLPPSLLIDRHAVP
jgi:hypothetical protein